MSTITADDQVRARQVLQALGAHARVTAEDGTVLDLPDAVLQALTEVLDAAAHGESALVVREPNDLTTQQAAQILGVSRPTVVRLIESGKLRAHMVGTHRRVTLTDVLEHADATARNRRQALDDMVREAEDLGLYE